MGVFRFVPVGGEGFCGAFENEAHYAGAGDWRREGEWSGVGRADEDRGYERDDGGFQGLRALGNGRKAQRGDCGIVEVFVRTLRLGYPEN